MQSTTKTNNQTTNPEPEEPEVEDAAIGGETDNEFFDPEPSQEEPVETVPRSRILTSDALRELERAFADRVAAVPVTTPSPKWYQRVWGWIVLWSEVFLAAGASMVIGTLLAIVFTPTVMQFLRSMGHLGFWEYHWAMFGLWFNHRTDTYEMYFWLTAGTFALCIYSLALFAGRGK